MLQKKLPEGQPRRWAAPLAGLWLALAALLWSLPLARYGAMIQSLMHTQTAWQGGILALVVGSGTGLAAVRRQRADTPGLSLRAAGVALVPAAAYLLWAGLSGGMGTQVAVAVVIDALLLLGGLFALTRLRPAAGRGTDLLPGLVALLGFGVLAAVTDRLVTLPWTRLHLAPPYYPTTTSAVLVVIGLIVGLSAGLTPLSEPEHTGLWRLIGRAGVALGAVVILINPLVTSIALAFATPPAVQLVQGTGPVQPPPGVKDVRDLGAMDVGGVTYHLQAATIGPERCALIMIVEGGGAYGNLTACQGAGLTQTTLFSERPWRFWQPTRPPLRFHVRYGEVIDSRVARITASLGGQPVEAVIAGRLWYIDLRGTTRQAGALTGLQAWDAAGKPLKDLVFDGDRTSG